MRELRNELEDEYGEGSKYLEEFDAIEKHIHKFTNIEYNLEMLPSTRKKLTEYFMPSIHELEGMIGKSLKGIWYE
jgi:hypothetical protein